MSPEYFFHHLTYYEATAYIEGVNMRMRAGWEQARLILSGLGLKNAKTECPFPWDDELDTTDDNKDEDEIARIKQLIKNRQDKLNKNNNG